MPKYTVHYKPADAAKDILADVDAPSYRAALTRIRHAYPSVTVYSIKPAQSADIEAAPITALEVKIAKEGPA